MYDYDYDYGGVNGVKKNNYKQAGQWFAKCGVYDLLSNEWIECNDYHYTANLQDQYNFKCGLCTDCPSNSKYICE